MPEKKKHFEDVLKTKINKHKKILKDASLPMNERRESERKLSNYFDVWRMLYGNR